MISGAGGGGEEGAGAFLGASLGHPRLCEIISPIVGFLLEREAGMDAGGCLRLAF